MIENLPFEKDIDELRLKIIRFLRYHDLYHKSAGGYAQFFNMFYSSFWNGEQMIFKMQDVQFYYDSATLITNNKYEKNLIIFKLGELARFYVKLNVFNIIFWKDVSFHDDKGFFDLNQPFYPSQLNYEAENFFLESSRFINSGFRLDKLKMIIESNGSEIEDSKYEKLKMMEPMLKNLFTELLEIEVKRSKGLAFKMHYNSEDKLKQVHKEFIKDLIHPLTSEENFISVFKGDLDATPLIWESGTRELAYFIDQLICFQHIIIPEGGQWKITVEWFLQKDDSRFTERSLSESLSTIKRLKLDDDFKYTQIKNLLS